MALTARIATSDAIPGKSFVLAKAGATSTPRLWGAQLATTKAELAHSFVAGFGTGVAQPNRSPVANAGAPQSAAASTLVTLDGTGSFDPDAGDTITYSWAHTSGPYTGALSSSTASQPTYTPTVGGIDVWRLTVTDSHGATSSATTNVSVTTPTVAAVALWDGGSWVQKPLTVWSGAAWV